MPPRMILEIQDRSGKVVWRAPGRRQATRPSRRQAAYLVTDILAGNTDPRRTRSGPPSSRSATARTASAGRRRPRPAPRTTPATSRRTASSRRRPTAKAPALAVGVWMGNSDHSIPRSSEPATSLTAAAPLWRAFVRELHATGGRSPSSGSPKGVVRDPDRRLVGRRARAVDAATRVASVHRRARSRARRTRSTSPGCCTARSCGAWRVDPVKAELGPRSWDVDVDDWLARARRGVGVMGLDGTRARRTSGNAPAGAGRWPARATSRRAVGPWQRERERPWQRERQRAQTAAGSRAARWTARPSASGGSAVGATRDTRPWREQAGSQCGRDIGPGICHAARSGAFLGFSADTEHQHRLPSPSGRL